MRQIFRMLLITIFAAVVCPAGVLAEPRLRCQITQSGQTQVRDFAPTTNPYEATAIDLNGSFRFKAVVVGSAQRLDYVKIYTYYQTRRQPVLLQAVKYLSPALPSGAAADALTGTHFLYSPRLGRELQYGCTLLEVAS